MCSFFERLCFKCFCVSLCHELAGFDGNSTFIPQREKGNGSSIYNLRREDRISPLGQMILPVTSLFLSVYRSPSLFTSHTQTKSPSRRTQEILETGDISRSPHTRKPLKTWHVWRGWHAEAPEAKEDCQSSSWAKPGRPLTTPLPIPTFPPAPHPPSHCLPTWHLCADGPGPSGTAPLNTRH